MTVANPTIEKYKLVYDLSQKKSAHSAFEVGVKLRKIDEATRGPKFKVFVKVVSLFSLLLAPMVLFRK